MSFMDCFIYDKALTYSADCDTCGATIYAHESTGTCRAELADGSAECPHCANGHADPLTLASLGRMYAGRYSAPGYMDCTDWQFDTSARRLREALDSMFGDDTGEDDA